MAALRGMHGSCPKFCHKFMGEVEFYAENVADGNHGVVFLRLHNGPAIAAQDCNSPWRMFSFRANSGETGKSGASMRVLGIDPGLRNLGWGVIDVAGARISHVANGICHSAPGEGDLALRLVSLYSQLTEVLRQYAPDAAAVEHTFVNKDAVATLKLGQARGIALLVPAQFGLTVGEYAPNAVKKAIVGVGHAAKDQVDHMVRLHLPGVKIAGPDAADALAIAICHAHHLQSAGRLQAALKRAAG
jgi:crossover junction endodeoxyribonuclease RuvC